jgi:hypothetical protein
VERSVVVAAELRDLILRPLPRTLLVPTETREFTKGTATPDVTWGRTFTGTATATILVENDDLLTAHELEAVQSGEAQIARGESVTLAELEKTLEE